MKWGLLLGVLGILCFQGVDAQCASTYPPVQKRCRTYAKPCTQPTTCSYESWRYWYCYCQAERSWYETMDYPNYRSWKRLAAISR